MNRFETHRFVLQEVLRIVSKPVLELGAGTYSTIPINQMSKKRGISCLTIESNGEWFQKYSRLRTDLHRFRYYNEEESKKFYKEDTTEWGLVFVDSSSWKDRVLAIRKYHKTADYMILHDCDYFPNNEIFGVRYSTIRPWLNKTGVRTYDDVFRYWIEFFIKDWKRGDPPTLLGSNKIDLTNFIIDERLIVSNRSKL